MRKNCAWKVISRASENQFKYGKLAVIGSFQTVTALRKHGDGVELVDDFFFEEIDVDRAVKQHVYDRVGIVCRAGNAEYRQILFEDIASVNR